MQPFFAQYQDLILIVLGVVSLVSLILALTGSVSISALRRRFRKWKGIHATADLDEVYAQTLEQVGKLRAELEDARREMDELRHEMRVKVSTAQVMRYNAFQEVGSDLSFSMALLDDEQNGVVLSSIYGRDESRTYAKPIEGGASRYTLTEEERQVIAQAAQGAHSQGSNKEKKRSIKV